jgi:type I restriction enzyme S subunit
MTKEVTMEKQSLTDGWESKEFEKCLEKVTYSKKIKRKEFLSQGLNPIISQEKEKINGYWDNSDDLFKVNKPVVIFGDHTKILKYIDFDFVLGADGVKILLANENINSRYLFYFLQNIELGDLGYARHYRLLKEIQILYPKSIPQQKQIVATLDKAFVAIDTAKANAKQNLQNAKELFESYLQNVFENKGDDWEEKTLGEVCEFVQGIQRGVKLQSEICKEGQIRFLRIIDFTQGKQPPRYIDNPGDKYIMNNKDVSLVRYGASTGFVCQGKVGALANNLFRVKPKLEKELLNDFLFVFLSSGVFQNIIKASMNGAAMPAISFGLIKDIKFPIVSINEQNEIIKKLEKLKTGTKKLEVIYKQKIADLEEMKKSVLQKAFSGQLNTIN